MDESLTALFVRVPTELAELLDRRSDELGRSKQSMVAEFLGDRLASPTAVDAGDGTSIESGTVIMDLDDVADMLAVSTDDVLERIRCGDFPGRRFGTTWRFARSAVVEWMAGSDPLHDHPTGF